MIKINSTKVEIIIEKPDQRELPDVSKTLQEFELIDKIISTLYYYWILE